MEVFFLLLLKIVPLYFLIFIGFLARKILQVPKEGVARLLIYVFSPAIVFLGTVQAGLNRELFAIPIIVFVIATILCLSIYFLTRNLWKDATGKIAAFAAGTGNTGYFGLPVCLALFGDVALPIVAMISIGLILFENTVGFYVVARSSHSAKKSLYKLLSLPSLYAFVIGLVINLFAISTPEKVIDFFNILKGGYVPLGMMIVGLGLAEMKISHFDWKFTVLSLSNKFILWPLIFLGVIYLDKTYFHLFNELIYSVLIVESIVPIAANTVTYATELKAHPEKASFIVIVSTFIALFYIPAVAAFFL